MPFKSKYTPFRHNYLVKKRTKSTGQGSTPSPPPNGQCPFKIIFIFLDVVLKGRCVETSSSHVFDLCPTSLAHCTFPWESKS